MTTNTLYFEGAGMEHYGEAAKVSDVGNFRIRTAFTNLDGVQYYIEMGDTPRYDKKFKRIPGEMALRIDHLFKIEDRNKEEYNLGGYEIKTDHMELRKLDYTRENITKWINENLNCDFDTIEVLDDFHGYRVHGERLDGESTFNMMEDVEIIPERAKARREVFEKVDEEYRKALNERYSKITRHGMDDESITIRSYASDESLKKAGLPRVKRLEVKY